MNASWASLVRPLPARVEEISVLSTWQHFQKHRGNPSVATTTQIHEGKQSPQVRGQPQPGLPTAQLAYTSGVGPGLDPEPRVSCAFLRTAVEQI